MHKYSELHIVSDLHLGGPRGRRIFAQTPALASWIRRLAATAPDRELGLVLNGDIFDFLAAENATHFDAEHAVQNLVAILDEFEPIKAALQEFVALPRRRLVLVVGNHDIELAMPFVQDEFVRVLVKGSDEAAARVHLALDGRGYECRVGDQSVYCVHGNEADDWNVVDYARVREVGEAVRRRDTPPELRPNAGTRLVIEVMNDVKKTKPFVDLLKPEGKRLIGLLLVLEPALVRKILPSLGPVSTLVHAVLRRWGVLAEGGMPIDPAAQQALAEEIALAMSAEETPSAAELLERAERALEDGVEPLDLVTQGDAALLGLSDGALRLVLGLVLGNDRTFDVRTTDSVFRKLDAALAPEFDFIVAGHTHLARAHRRTRGRGVYFNSGTWIRLLEVDQHVLASEHAFKPFYDALASSSMEGLARFDRQRRTSVAIREENGQVVGELRQVDASLAEGFSLMEHGRLSRLDSTQENGK